MGQIKIKNSYLDRIVNSKVRKTILEKSFSAKISYWISKFFNIIENDLEIYINERNKLVEKYGEKDENGEVISSNEQVKIKSSEGNNFLKEFTELSNIEISIAITPIKISLEDLPDLTPEEMQILQPLFDIEV